MSGRLGGRAKPRISGKARPRPLGVAGMDYSRYALGHYARSYWIYCVECTKNKDEPHYVFRREEREVNMTLPVNAIVQHEVAAHLSNPKR